MVQLVVDNTVDMELDNTVDMGVDKMEDLQHMQQYYAVSWYRYVGTTRLGIKRLDISPQN